MAKEILHSRDKTHGNWDTCSRVSQTLKDLTALTVHPLSLGQKEALSFILTKIARIICGDPNHKDHWDDIAGYAMLVSGELDVSSRSEGLRDVSSLAKDDQHKAVRKRRERTT